MGFKFFVIPIHASEEIETELNHFLLTHRVISVNRQFIADGSNSCWAMCIEFISGKNVEGTVKYSPLSRNRIDYKSILSPDEFTVYSQLRALRKEIAQIEAVPVYTLFTNEQLAQIVQRKCQSKSDLIGIEGVSEVKVEKYLDKLLNILHPLTDYHNETNRESV